MIDQEMLEAMAAMLEPLNKKLDNVQTELAEVRATMATKDELAEVRTDLAEVRATMATKDELAEVQAKLSKEIASVKEDTASIRETAKIYNEWTDNIELRVRNLERGAL